MRQSRSRTMSSGGQPNMIAQIGQWKKKKGTLFALGEGLDWHRDNTAVWARDWGRNQEQQITSGEKLQPPKTTTVDDRNITYDLSVWLEGDVRHISYHCNPASNGSSRWRACG